MGLLRWPLPHEVLPGRQTRMPVPQQHYVLQTPLTPPFPTNLAVAMFGMGCFWGAEKKFWQTDGVFSTAVGYSGGVTPNPFYEEVCSGMTAHNEVVQVVFDPAVVPFTDLLRLFWQGHNPTTGMRQGNDIGTQYRSAIYCLDDKQLEEARHSAKRYQQALDKAGMGMITTEILPAQDFYYAEPYHQQYLARNPSGYCPDITCQATGLPAFPS